MPVIINELEVQAEPREDGAPAEGREQPAKGQPLSALEVRALTLHLAQRMARLTAH